MTEPPPGQSPEPPKLAPGRGCGQAGQADRSCPVDGLSQPAVGREPRSPAEVLDGHGKETLPRVHIPELEPIVNVRGHHAPAIGADVKESGPRLWFFIADWLLTWHNLNAGPHGSVLRKSVSADAARC